jgi:hypothetical protein
MESEAVKKILNPDDKAEGLNMINKRIAALEVAKEIKKSNTYIIIGVAGLLLVYGTGIINTTLSGVFAIAAITMMSIRLYYAAKRLDKLKKDYNITI